MNKPSIITVFEHDSLKVRQQGFSKQQLTALQKFASSGTPFFTLIHNGIKFNQYVGVLRVGELIIEILPKPDRKDPTDAPTWRSRLIGMIRAVRSFKVQAPTQSAQRISPTHLLELYFELFVIEVECLIRHGLVRKYQGRQGNQTALRGRLLFDRHLRENLIHKERFYVQDTTYDQSHLIHSILHQTLQLLQRVNRNAALQGRIQQLLFYFPEQTYRRITEQTFKNIRYNRKVEPYREALGIARLLLLNYHPSLYHGQEDILALLFDMNTLWESFVLVSLKRELRKDCRVSGQVSKPFFQFPGHSIRSIRPDLVVRRGDQTLVLDTKWKNLGQRPSMADLRQLYVYGEFWDTSQTAIIFPGRAVPVRGDFKRLGYSNSCSLVPIAPVGEVGVWQQQIAQEVVRLFE